jgi:hypothetical protein
VSDVRCTEFLLDRSLSISCMCHVFP